MRDEARRVAVVSAAVVSLLLGPTASASRAEVEMPALARWRPSQDRMAANPRPAEAIDQELQSELEGYLGGRPGLYGLAVRNLDTGQTVLINEDREFLAASTYKVLVMYRVYQQRELGGLHADDKLTITTRDVAEGDSNGGPYPGQVVTVGEALEKMIAVSSNTAAYALTRRVGGWSSVAGAATELGMTQTGLRAGYFVTTPRDMLRFFTALAAGRLVGANASNRMTGLLAQQRINDRIPALLPTGAAVAHKTGELPGVRNDVGIVYGPSGSYIICAFGRSANVDQVTDVIAETSRLVYDRYAR